MFWHWAQSSLGGALPFTCHAALQGPPQSDASRFTPFASTFHIFDAHRFFQTGLFCLSLSSTGRGSKSWKVSKVATRMKQVWETATFQRCVSDCPESWLKKVFYLFVAGECWDVRVKLVLIKTNFLLRISHNNSSVYLQFWEGKAEKEKMNTPLLPSPGKIPWQEYFWWHIFLLHISGDILPSLAPTPTPWQVKH